METLKDAIEMTGKVAGFADKHSIPGSTILEAIAAFDNEGTRVLIPQLVDAMHDDSEDNMVVILISLFLLGWHLGVESTKESTV